MQEMGGEEHYHTHHYRISKRTSIKPYFSGMVPQISIENLTRSSVTQTLKAAHLSSTTTPGSHFSLHSRVWYENFLNVLTCMIVKLCCCNITSIYSILYMSTHIFFYTHCYPLQHLFKKFRHQRTQSSCQVPVSALILLHPLSDVALKKARQPTYTALIKLPCFLEWSTPSANSDGFPCLKLSL